MISLLQLMYLMALLGRMSGGGIVKFPDRVSMLPELGFAAIFAAAFYFSDHYVLRASLPVFEYLFNLIGLGIVNPTKFLQFLIMDTTLLVFIWTYLFMETGHGTALAMGQDPSVAQSGRKQTLSPIVDWICDKVNAPLGGSLYCWIFFALKGFLIGVPIFPYGSLLGLLWPLSYQIGAWIQKIHRTAGGAAKELLSGACAGYCIYLFAF